MTEKQIEAKVKSLMEANPGLSADDAIDQVLDSIANGEPKELSLAERIAAKKASANTATATATKSVKATSAPVKAKVKAKSKQEIADEAFETMPDKLTIVLDKYEFSKGSKGYRTPENWIVADAEGNEFALAKANLVILDTRRKDS